LPSAYQRLARLERLLAEVRVCIVEMEQDETEMLAGLCAVIDELDDDEEVGPLMGADTRG
jgi:hypothetical protein